MTMPFKGHEVVWVDDQDVFPVEVMGFFKYIRADIAEYLAKALEAMGDDKVSDSDFNRMRNQALARYNAATKKGA